MKKIPIGIPNFEKIIKEGWLYVDKTEQIYQLLQHSPNYFLARPRRFGKSLLLSTLASLFSGKKDLFEGLWIHEKSDYDWPTYQVIHLDFSRIRTRSLDVLYQTCAREIELSASFNNTDVPEDTIPELKLETLKSSPFLCVH